MSPDAPEMQVLRRARWFASLPSVLQARIAELGTLRRFAAGECLLREGDRPRGMFGLVEGRTRHVVAAGEDQEVLMHVGGPGLWTGEYSMLSGERCIGSVIATEPTRALHLSAKHWQALVDEDPDWTVHCARLLAERFATAYRAYADAQALPRDEWVHARLQLLARVESGHGAPTPRIRMSQADLASMVGVSRQTLNAVLARLQRRGLVRVGFREIVLVG
jgi:CRP/FNR family transcriptional regulator, cyclic AMP receptor protein